MDYDSVVVLQAYIPKSYYLIENGMNTFNLIEDGITAIITMPQGNYSRGQFRYILNNKLNQMSPHNIKYTITSPSATDPETGLFTYTKDSNLPVQFVFTNFIHDQMGFDANTVVDFGNTLVSTKVVNFNKHDCVYIQSNICVNNNNKSILQEVLTSGVEPFASIKFSNTSPIIFAKKMANSKSNIFSFFLTNEDDNPLDLHGLKL